MTGGVTLSPSVQSLVFKGKPTLEEPRGFPLAASKLPPHYRAQPTEADGSPRSIFGWCNPGWSRHIS